MAGVSYAERLGWKSSRDYYSHRDRHTPRLTKELILNGRIWYAVALYQGEAENIRLDLRRRHAATCVISARGNVSFVRITCVTGRGSRCRWPLRGLRVALAMLAGDVGNAQSLLHICLAKYFAVIVAFHTACISLWTSIQVSLEESASFRWFLNHILSNINNVETKKNVKEVLYLLIRKMF